MPPLRERPEDIPLLAEHFVHKLAGKLGISSPSGLAPESVEHFRAYRWPGNVREMENVMERAMVLSQGKLITVSHLPQEIAAPVTTTVPKTQFGVWQDEPIEPEVFALDSAVEQLERRCIAKALELSGDNKAKASRLLEISERTLWYKLKKYNLIDEQI